MQTPKRSLVEFGVLAVFAVSHLAAAAISDGLIGSIIKNWGGSQPGQFHFGLTSGAGDLSCFPGL
jgi:hypothetical protein